jgi:hypothetical protein
MTKPQMYQTPNGPVLGIDTNVGDIDVWAPSIGKLRDTILAYLCVGTSMIDNLPVSSAGRAMAPTQAEVEAIADMAGEAVRHGRLFDFAELSNDVIKYGGVRGGALYNRGAIRHPFREPWVFTHTWDSHGRMATTVYLVSPLGEDAWGDCEVIELEPMAIRSQHVLMIGDRVLIQPGEDHGGRKYDARAMPSIWRYLPGAERMNNGGAPEAAAAGNVLDPLMTALLILSTRGVARETVKADAKLQRARAKGGKPPIPPFERIATAAYVTAITHRQLRGRKPSQGGHHASPVAHLRAGHIRNLADGRTTFVRDALVNFTDDAKAGFTAGRSHYTVR